MAITIKFRVQLHEAAKSAGIKTPAIDQEGDLWFYYPAFELFRELMMGKELPDENTLLNNAKIIASIPEKRCEEVTKKDLTSLGFILGKKKGE